MTEKSVQGVRMKQFRNTAAVLQTKYRLLQERIQLILRNVKTYIFALFVGHVNYII